MYNKLKPFSFLVSVMFGIGVGSMFGESSDWRLIVLLGLFMARDMMSMAQGYYKAKENL